MLRFNKEYLGDKEKNLRKKIIVLALLSLTACLAFFACHSGKSNSSDDINAKPSSSNSSKDKNNKSVDWEKELFNIKWVAYYPTNADPNKNIDPTVESMKKDLNVLKNAGFSGLVTYGCKSTVGQELPKIAEELGFKGLIVGIWNPLDGEEIDNAKSVAGMKVVFGYCVGNEGFDVKDRYNFETLKTSISGIKNSTGKPVTTSEEVDDYLDQRLIDIGDWVFPNAHPYFHSRIKPKEAVEWTKGAFNSIKQRTSKPVLFKEVGLPTQGDQSKKQDKLLSEKGQDEYYQLLAKSEVKFVYFEAFDQPWKTHLPVEPHWGIFDQSRNPKLLGWHLMEKEPSKSFYIYENLGSPNNNFFASGYMGDIGDIHIDEAWSDKPYKGNTCIKVVYDAKGKGPNECSYPPPCKWSGVYWQEPANNWGKDVSNKDYGYDLSNFNCLTFYAKAEKECRIEFKVGGINEEYGDSLNYPVSIEPTLTTEWKEYVIKLDSKSLTHIIGGFAWATNWNRNPNGATFYLDEIRFENR